MVVKKKDVEEKEVKKPVKQEEVKPTPKKLENDYSVTIMNNTSGQVFYRSKRTGVEWSLFEYGETSEIPLDELISLKNAHRRYLNDTWLIILDEDVVKHLGLQKLYENVLTPDELDRFYRLPADQVIEILSKMPKGMQETVVGQAMIRTENKTLSDLNVIRAIEDTLKVDIWER
jgi:hypothetical protein